MTKGHLFTTTRWSAPVFKQSFETDQHLLLSNHRIRYIYTEETLERQFMRLIKTKSKWQFSNILIVFSRCEIGRSRKHNIKLCILNKSSAAPYRELKITNFYEFTKTGKNR